MRRWIKKEVKNLSGRGLLGKEGGYSECMSTSQKRKGLGVETEELGSEGVECVNNKSKTSVTKISTREDILPCRKQ